MGSPVFLDDICAVHCATLRQIIEVGYDNFLKFLGVMTTTKPIPSEIKNAEIEEIIKDLSDFEYFLLMATSDSLTGGIVRRAFRFFLQEKNILFSLNPA